MAVNYEHVNDQIVKIARGLEYQISMYDEMGSGPISSTQDVKYIELQPDGIMIALPNGGAKERDEVFVYIGKLQDKMRFIRLSQRLKVLAKMNALGYTLQQYPAGRNIKQHLADEARSRIEQKQKEEF